MSRCGLKCPYVHIGIRRPLPSLGLGGAAPGITVDVRHWFWHQLCHLCQLAPGGPWHRCNFSPLCQGSFSPKTQHLLSIGPFGTFLPALEPSATPWNLPLQLPPFAPRVAKLFQLQPQNLLSIGFRSCRSAHFAPPWNRPLRPEMHVSPRPETETHCSFNALRQGLPNCCNMLQLSPKPPLHIFL